MQKPDMRTMREAATLPLFISGDNCLDQQSRSRVKFLGRCITQLCDYIDSIPETTTVETVFTASLNAEQVTQAVADAKAEIRKFVESQNEYVIPSGGFVSAPTCKRAILDFIDNGPKKPTAEEIIFDIFNGDKSFDQFTVAGALREAGLLKEDS
jgi:hypothetical protein